MCSILIEKYGTKVPVCEKENIALMIIKLIPCLRDPMGKKGYVSNYNPPSSSFFFILVLILGGIFY